MFKAEDRNPLFYLIPPLKINPDLKIKDFKAKLNTYREIYTKDQLDPIQREMIQALLESFNNFFHHERL